MLQYKSQPKPIDHSLKYDDIKTRIPLGPVSVGPNDLRYRLESHCSLGCWPSLNPEICSGQGCRVRNRSFYSTRMVFKQQNSVTRQDA